MKLEGKKALITGGNGGIGLAIARFFIVSAAWILSSLTLVLAALQAEETDKKQPELIRL
ncbi:hypothetical protein [Nostoc flagelliforme]|uniref:hypothetical protein n=1 Tax=Nostoc flagelliforme TaxID=1306274 RepID=UPI0018F03292|nr:hypothetical protein [Nostoc flagelliforme]